MKKTKVWLLLFVACLIASMFLPMLVNEVHADTANEVTLNFDGGTIKDGYVEYSEVAKVQLFKGDELVVNISNGMTINLNEANYELVIEEIEDSSVSEKNTSVKLNINNNWYYPITDSILEETKSTFKLESSKFSGTLNIKFLRVGTFVNTKVENVYNDISSKGEIDLTNEKEYVIDFSKTDELTEGLKSFADLDKTLYYKRDNAGLSTTDNESEAVIKIVGSRDENKAILTAINVGDKKSDVFKGLHTKYTGSSLKYDGTSGGVIQEIRTDYYTRCKYEFTFQYVKEEEQQPGETQEDNENTGNTGNTETEEQPENNNVANNDVQKNNTIANPKTGDNVVTYFALFAIALLGIVALLIVNNVKRKN